MELNKLSGIIWIFWVIIFPQSKYFHLRSWLVAEPVATFAAKCHQHRFCTCYLCLLISLPPLHMRMSMITVNDSSWIVLIIFFFHFNKVPKLLFWHSKRYQNPSWFVKVLLWEAIEDSCCAFTFGTTKSLVNPGGLWMLLCNMGFSISNPTSMQVECWAWCATMHVLHERIWNEWPAPAYQSHWTCLWSLAESMLPCTMPQM